MRLRLVALATLLGGCQTTLDPNYALQLESYRLTISSQQAVEVAKARAEEARYNAMATIADHADPQSKQMAILALALGRGGEASAGRVAAVLPNPPESQEDRALKWAAIFAGPVTSVATGYFGYQLGKTQSNNQANSTIASYNAFSNTAVAGFNANRDIAGSGFGAIQNVATGAFALIPQMKPTTPNIITTLNGTGVIAGRDGSYVGPNSGTNSGNAGRINSPNDDHRAVTCTPTPDIPC